jgi:hypothetical protein
VFHIQDVHLNQEAQNNIAGAIRELSKTRKIGAVALEGAFEPIDLREFQNFPHPEQVRIVSETLLLKNKISGPIRIAMQTPDFPAVIGVDDFSHYWKNVEAYRVAAPHLKETKERIAADRRILADRKKALFNPALAAFDARVEAYRDGSIPLALFAASLHGGADLSNYVEASRLESTMNYQTVERERSELLNALLPKLSGNDRSELVQKSAAYRAGNLTPADFFRFFEQLCSRNHVPLNRYSGMRDYLRYVFLSSSIDGESLFEDIKRAEDKTFATLARTDEERRLINESKQRYLLAKLADFSLTREEWNEYKTMPHKAVPGFEDFYKEAEIRDREMADNFLRRVSDGTSVLVTGGFHAAGIDRRLSDAGYTVVAFVPKITKIDSASGSA